jgi:segregation and condensation protein A
LSSAPLNIHLEHYDGPLDLLLALIHRQQINIYDIPIASITSQYMEFLHRAAELDIELSSEFVYMAASLIHIKSRMLLPRDPELDKIAPEPDPRTELVQRLLEHERFKNAAEMLQQKRMVEEAVWSNPQISAFLPDEDPANLSVTLFDLVQTFQQVLERIRSRPVYRVEKEDVTVPEMIRYLAAELKATDPGGMLSTAKLFGLQRSHRAMICLFLAILELVKLQAIVLTQRDAFGDIGLKRQQGWEQVLESTPALTAIEQEYN